MKIEKFDPEEFDKGLFLEVCKMSGVKVTPGTGKLLMNGKEFDPVEVIKKAFPDKDDIDACFLSK